jgi:hypothetical protein
VPAHAVEDQHQARVFRHNDGSPILVVLTISDGGDFGVFDPHAARYLLLFSFAAIACFPARVSVSRRQWRFGLESLPSLAVQRVAFTDGRQYECTKPICQ